MEVVLNVLIWLIPVVAILVTVLILRKVFRGSNKKNIPNPPQYQPVKQSGPVPTINHQAAPGAAPATGNKMPQAEAVSAKKAVPVKAKTVTVSSQKERKPMNNRDEILNVGKSIYLSLLDRYTGLNNRAYTDGPAYSAAKYILAEERFTTNHDDTAMFIELIDEDEKVMKSWKFDYPMKKWFSDPDYYEDDCLVLYLMESFHLPTVGYRAPK